MVIDAVGIIDVEQLFLAVYNLEFFNCLGFGYFWLDLVSTRTRSFNIAILVIVMKERIFIFIKHLLLWVLQYFCLCRLLFLLTLWFASLEFFRLTHILVLTNSLYVVAVWHPISSSFLLFLGFFCKLFILRGSMICGLWLFLFLKFNFCQVFCEWLHFWEFVKFYFLERVVVFWWICCLICLILIWNYKWDFMVGELRAKWYFIEKILVFDLNFFEILFEFFLNSFICFKNF